MSVKNSFSNPVPVNDSTQTAGLDTTLTIGAGLTVELKVGSSAKSNRKYILIPLIDSIHEVLDRRFGISAAFLNRDHVDTPAPA